MNDGLPFCPDGDQIDHSAGLLDTLPHHLEARRQSIEEGIAAFLARHYEGRVLEVVGYLVCGGKRLRGILALLVCEALGGTARDALPAAVAVELAHAASLAHDDIMDADVTRRGRPALHVHYDVPTAILVPHLVVPHAILSAQVYGAAAVRAILAGWARVAAGQAQDYLPLYRADRVRPSCSLGNAIGRQATPETEYLTIIRNKTAALFETAADLGALAAKDDRRGHVARAYGASLGSAFQIADDVTDLERRVDQPWATLLGDDVPRGAQSIAALRRVVSRPDEQAITRAAIARARDLATLDVARCLACAARFPESFARELLREFPSFAIDRIYAELP